MATPKTLHSDGGQPGLQGAHIRWSKELSDGEKAATQERRKFIADCLGRHLVKCDEDRVPRVALLGSGGGLRAMITLMGTLSELATQDLLDSIMYLCGVSGSTWCMSSLYEDTNWSRNIKECENRLNESLNSPIHPNPSVWHKIRAATEEGGYSLTVLWSYLVGNHMIRNINEKNLTNHKEACEQGINPYPIYAAVEKEHVETARKNMPGTWFEFTPHDAGFPDYGAFVKTEAIGCQFAMGSLAAEKAQQSICYLRGLWGSALASEREIKTQIRDYIFNWFIGDHDGTMGLVQSFDALITKHGGIAGIHLPGIAALHLPGPAQTFLECCSAAYTLLTLPIEELETEVGKLALQNLEKLLEVISTLYEKTLLVAKLMKCLIFWQWGTTHNYLYKCSSQDTAFPSELAHKEYIHLIDAGLAINSAYPLVLRPERKVDLILSFDFSAGDPFETLKKSAEYCKHNNIPFPDITVEEKDEKTPSGCYIFKEPNAPTVMHFPLFNLDNCAGDIEKYRSTFSTFQTSYGKKNLDDLLRVSKLNVQKHTDKILHELQLAVHA
ncbi:cytosolic phospholipase A2 gamma-like isoform X2 [Ambystoma mexicanum]|uniref:cytosolic phospholipase A2 gamma-like isoform X2 n=1 Tax=Ambystoma mexicanum TaxID=8296 RepID=UPI0037E96B63